MDSRAIDHSYALLAHAAMPGAWPPRSVRAAATLRFTVETERATVVHIGFAHGVLGTFASISTSGSAARIA
jgi:hypothetical protein